jgi:hypothetical protein
MAEFQEELTVVNRAAPLSERIARAFGVLMMQGELNEHAIRVVGYLFATCGFLEREAFESRRERTAQEVSLDRHLMDVRNYEAPNCQGERVDVTASRDARLPCFRNV